MFKILNAAQYLRTLQIALPIMISYLGHMVVGLADSIMIGQVGTVPLAAASLVNSILILVMVLGFGLSHGITPLVAAAADNKRKAGFSPLLYNSIVQNILAGIAMVLVLLTIYPLVYYLGQPHDVVLEGEPYMAIMALSLLPLMVFQGFKQFAEGLSFTLYAMIVSLVANLLNILLNYLLIYGNWGFPELGLAGAGYASFISRIVLAVLIAGYVLLHPHFKPYNLRFHFRQFNGKLQKRLLNIGLPIGLQMIFEISSFAGAALMMGWLGADQLAAHQIALSLAALTYMVANGLAAAATVRVGNQIGRKDYLQMREVAFSATHMALLFMGVSAVLFLLLRHILPTVFIDSPVVIALASQILVVAALFQLSDGLQVVALGSLRGMGDVKGPSVITFISYWLIGLPAGYVLGFVAGFGALGIWYGLFLGLTTAAILLIARFHFKSLKLLNKFVASAG